MVRHSGQTATECQKERVGEGRGGHLGECPRGRGVERRGQSERREKTTKQGREAGHGCWREKRGQIGARCGVERGKGLQRAEKRAWSRKGAGDRGS